MNFHLAGVRYSTTGWTIVAALMAVDLAIWLYSAAAVQQFG